MNDRTDSQGRVWTWDPHQNCYRHDNNRETIFRKAFPSQTLPLGIYRHWKGNNYITLFLARDSNNDANREDVVVYMSLTDPYAGSVNVRRLTEFLDDVDLPDGTTASRFTYVGPAPQGSDPKMA